MKGLLSKIEYIVIGLFALIFLMWAISKCNAHKEQAQEEASTEAREDSLANKAIPTAPTTPAVSQTVATNAVADTAQARPSQSAAQPAKPAEPQGSKLYVTIDKLKLRKAPGLKSETIGELKLFDEVYYMDEVTDSTFEVNLGKEIADEPYVKVKTKFGTIGWVYGAGVHYVKKKRSGVLE
ncbi:MAG: SH3 domain-containing protein [Lewinellaceae bacterium]|nr:SH3 domain-containing protein [Saprospiraceae bacterium]MCB9338274.1 SH3 domain-containing protein [Lewinellaceae bacterium]